MYSKELYNDAYVNKWVSEWKSNNSDLYKILKDLYYKAVDKNITFISDYIRLHLSPIDLYKIPMDLDLLIDVCFKKREVVVCIL